MDELRWWEREMWEEVEVDEGEGERGRFREGMLAQ